MGKTIGKDKISGKLTYVSLYGIEKSKEELNNLLDKCECILAKHNLKSEIFDKIINKIRLK